ncbi:GCN5-related N-acetyltransferase [Sphingomicrobium sp. XHP0235]|uniref:GCN5-related N-acetyltransferase n=1 Tax=Sphingomicrobium aquimarinum TaxID=3133971 RepID=UPI0031FE4C29
MTREKLEKRWFELTRKQLPSLAPERGWPIRFDHCFQRVLLDHAVGGTWREVIASPAYRNATDAQLDAAIALGERVLAGSVDLAALDRQSLEWRGKAR